MATKMESLYADLAEYFVFDVQKYTLEEFMSDIKTFKNQFKVTKSVPTLLSQLKNASFTSTKTFLDRRKLYRLTSGTTNEDGLRSRWFRFRCALPLTLCFC